jgi:hypothetical protein
MGLDDEDFNEVKCADIMNKIDIKAKKSIGM